METNAQVFSPQTHQNNQIPVISFTTENLTPSTSSWVSTCKAVREVMEEFSCFIAVYDKVESELISEVFASLKELFDLPVQRKLLKTNPDKPSFSYSGPRPDSPLHETMPIEDSTTTEAVQRFTNLMWPSGNEHFCETIHSYAAQVSKLYQIVTRMVFESYGVGKYCDSHIESTFYLLRTNAYKAPHENETNLGVPPHTDTSFVTVVKQDEVHGFEVQLKDGTWITVNFPPSSFVVTASDAMLAWSNGRIQACLHRVIMTTKERFSAALFSFHTGIVQIPKELADDNYPLRYNAFDHFGLLDFRAKNLALTSEERVTAYCGLKDVI